MQNVKCNVNNDNKCKSVIKINKLYIKYKFERLHYRSYIGRYATTYCRGYCTVVNNICFF